MTRESHSPISSHNRTVYGRLGFDPWTAEIATMDHAATNLSRLVYRFFSLVFAGVDALANAVQSLRKACPIEVEPVTIAPPVPEAKPVPTDQRAAA